MAMIRTKLNPDEKLTKKQIEAVNLPKNGEIDFSDIPKLTGEKLKLFKRTGKQATKKITINLNENVIVYFKEQAIATGIPYQTLINLYLTDCADKRKKPELSWL